MTRPNRERRAHKRFDLTCPVTVTDRAGKELLRTKTLNLSDGGALLTAISKQAVPLGQSVHMDLRLPRSTPNTFMFEDLSSDARVVRLHPTGDETAAALMFIEPLNLGLEV